MGLEMKIVNQAADNYQQQLNAQRQTDPLAQLAANVGLKVNSPEAVQKLKLMGEVVAQQAARVSQVQQADSIDKSTTAWKQAQFQG
jgi:hypothetical protein